MGAGMNHESKMPMRRPRRITVGVLDNDGLLLAMLGSLFRAIDPRINVIWTATQPEIAQERCLRQSTRPDVLLLDMSMPNESGVLICKRIRTQTDQVAILGMSSYELSDYAPSLAYAGAQGLVSKVPVENLISAIVAVANGKLYCTIPGVHFTTMGRAFRTMRSRMLENELGPLSAREAEIMDLVIRGHSSEDIAMLLECKSTTVRTHISHAKEKLGALNLGQATVRWMKIKEQW